MAQLPVTWDMWCIVHFMSSDSSFWQLAWCSNWSSSHRNELQKEQRKIRPPAHAHRHTQAGTRAYPRLLSTWPAEQQRTMVPHSSLALQAHSISKGTRASVGGETPAAVADPCLTKVTHSTLKDRTQSMTNSYHSKWSI